MPLSWWPEGVRSWRWCAVDENMHVLEEMQVGVGQPLKDQPRMEPPRLTRRCMLRILLILEQVKG